MTREEAIEVIKAYKDKLTNSASNQLDGDIEAFDMAIKALEQESKTGYWIEHNAKSYECSECHNNKSLYASYKTDYCHDCGARMESEDKE